MTPQQSIAHYRITSKLGEGGMGQVWRATDTKLNREVAIKVLPDSFAHDPDRLARFTREAQVLAALNHPNIAAIYGVEEGALVMEMAEGATLADRIARGPIPLDEALGIAREIAEALEYAHERGIVHRDLKPANIKIAGPASGRPGRVKVLDFGLAKALCADRAAGDPAASPTLSLRATEAGIILGTAAYMAPEQARGHEVDSSADIWAFGVVLHEMLSGRALFAGPTVSDTLAAVLKTDPDLTAVPEQVRPILERCLRKDPRRRWRSIGDARILLEEGLPAASAPAPVRGRRLPWAIAAATFAFAAAAGWLAAWRASLPPDRPLVRLSVDLGPDALIGLNITAAISPDGRRIVYPARGSDGRPQLATRLLDQAQQTFLPGTEYAHDPFFSPDSQWIGFFTGAQLRKISVQGGAPVMLGSASTLSQGGSWSEDGSIIAALGVLLPLSRIPAGGGPAQAITKLAPGEVTHRWPQVLPGGAAVIFTASQSATAQDNAAIEAVSMKTGQIKTVQRGGYYGRYLPSGHLVFVRQGALFGVAFDPVRLETRGAPTPLLEDVAANPTSAGGQFDFSSVGTFVYSAGKNAAQSWRMAWLDASGKLEPMGLAAGTYALPRLSPDGRKLAYQNGSDIYIYDLGLDTATRLTFTGVAGPVTWAPDGKHVVFQSRVNGITWMRADGAGEPQTLVEDPRSVMTPWCFSPDGRRVAFFETSPDSGFDISTLPLDLTDPDRPKAGKPEVFLRTPADELVPRFSPDGRWIAYRSGESGTTEIYVRPFPASNGGKWQISSGGGLYALWSNNGRELFYETVDNRIMVVDYTVDGASFVRGKPRLWSDKQLFYPGTSNLDLAPDGKRFAVFALPEAPPGAKASVHVTMLLNFFDELKRRIR